MKKILAVLLAVMMLLGTMSVGASAVIDDTSAYSVYYGMPTADGNVLVNSGTQTIIVFDLNGGKLKNNVWVYDTSASVPGFVNVAGDSVESPYVSLPRTPEMYKVGGLVALPTVTAPEGYQFDGWWHSTTKDTYAANGSYTVKAQDIGDVVVFTAGYSPAELEADTLDTILGILIKVFGAIIGIILYSGDTEAGVAMMEKVLGGLF